MHFKVVLEGKQTKRHLSQRLLQKSISQQFASSDAEEYTLGPLQRETVAALPWLSTLLSNP